LRPAAAVEHTILVIADQVLTRREMDHELGPNYFDEYDRCRVERRLVARLRHLGYSIDRKQAVGQSHPEPQSLVSQSTDKGSDHPVLSVP
jgi:hypothetical protein